MRRFFAWSTVAVTVAAVAALWLTTARHVEGDAIGLERYSIDRAVGKLAVSYLALLLCYVVLGRQSWKRRAAQVSLHLAAICLAMFLVELPALSGLVDYRTLLIPKSVGGTGPSNVRPDPELVFRRLPYDHFVSNQPGDWTISLGIATNRRYQAEYTSDKNGFRNARDLQRAPVVLVGDSFVEGYLVPQEETCSAQLGRLLGVEVANLGQSDYGPGQELVVVKKYAMALRPRAVVWFFFEFNDLDDLEDYESAVNNWEGYVRSSNTVSQRCFTPLALARLGAWVDRLRWRDSDIARRRSAQLLPEIRSGNGKMYFELTPFEISSHKLAWLDKMQKILREAASICRRDHCGFLVVNIPLKFRVYRDLCVLSEDGDLDSWELNDLPDCVGRACKADGIEYLDLTEPLRSAARQGTPVYFPDDGHWTESGHAVVAEEIARFISKAGWLKPRSASPKRSPTAGMSE